MPRRSACPMLSAWAIFIWKPRAAPRTAMPACARWRCMGKRTEKKKKKRTEKFTEKFTEKRCENFRLAEFHAGVDAPARSAAFARQGRHAAIAGRLRRGADAACRASSVVDGADLRAAVAVARLDHLQRQPHAGTLAAAADCLADHAGRLLVFLVVVWVCC